MRPLLPSKKLGVGSQGFLGYAYGKAGHRTEAELIAAQRRALPWVQALIRAGFGDKDKSIEGLRNMAAIGDPALETTYCSPNLPDAGRPAAGRDTQRARPAQASNRWRPSIRQALGHVTSRWTTPARATRSFTFYFNTIDVAMCGAEHSIFGSRR
jgi:hypothetical protein